MDKEKKLLLNEWYEYARADLESAKVLLKRTKNYHISLYHSHQSIEKILKYILLKNGKEFPFVHDLKKLLSILNEVSDYSFLKDDINKVNDLLPKVRYPSGDKIRKRIAQDCYNIAKRIFMLFKEK